MKTTLIALAFAAASSTALAADPVFGTWASPKSESGASIHVKVQQCGSSICGKIVKVLGGGDSSVMGRDMVWNMAPKGGGSYKGKIWAPDTNKTYNGKMDLSGNSLKMSGCVLGICRGETFSRIK